MSDFSTSSTLDVEVSNRSLKQARSTIESKLGNATADVTASIANSGGGGQTRGQLAGMLDASRKSHGQLTELVELAKPRNELLGEVLDETERGSGGGGGMGVVSTMGVSRGLSGMIGGASLGGLVTKVPLKSLLKRTPAFATLVTAASLSDDLVKGTLGPDDLVDSAISLGEIMTFGTIDNDKISGAIGAATLVGGTVQIGKIIGGTLGASTLGGMLGSVSLGVLLTPVAAAAGVTLAGLLGTVAINKLVEEPKGSSGGMAGEGSGSTRAAVEGPGGEIPLEDEFQPGEGVPPSERPRGNDGVLETIRSNALENRHADTVPSTSAASSGSTASGSSGSGGNRARESSQDVRVDHSPTFNVDLSKLERMFDRDLRDLQRQVNDLEDKFKRASRGR